MEVDVRQRLEQNGLYAGSSGLPQIGQKRAVDVLWSISFIERRLLATERSLCGGSHRV
jgi:hypothetical protein